MLNKKKLIEILLISAFLSFSIILAVALVGNVEEIGLLGFLLSIAFAAANFLLGHIAKRNNFDVVKWFLFSFNLLTALFATLSLAMSVLELSIKNALLSVLFYLFTAEYYGFYLLFNSGIVLLVVILLTSLTILLMPKILTYAKNRSKKQEILNFGNEKQEK